MSRDGAVLAFEIDRPKKRNALTDPIVAAMIEALSAAGPDESVRVVVISGAGDHFCAGFDIVGRNAGDERPRVGSIQRRLPTEAHRLIELLLTTQTPVVCRVQGWAAGIGLHVALAADFAVVDDVDGTEDSACEVTPATRFVAVTATRSGPAPVIYLSIDGPADYRIFVRSKRFTAREAAALIVGAHGGHVRLADASL